MLADFDLGMKKDITNELIKKYLAGICSQSEKELVDEWFTSFDQANDFISDLPDNEQELVKNNLLNKIKTNIKKAENNALLFNEAKAFQLPTIKKPKSLVFYITKIAAVLIFTFGLGFLGFKYLTQLKLNDSVADQIIFINNKKLVKKITLQDGSKVWLQENSTLEVYSEFGNYQRKVSLEGEAFFEVAKDKTRPFEIKTGEVTTRVLGTSFNIKAYEVGATVEIAVITGQVSVLKAKAANATAESLRGNSPETAEVILLPNQKATYRKSTHDLIKNKVLAENRRLVWAKSSFSFENTPIRQVIKHLNNQFDTTIKLENEDLNNCSIYGDFTNQNLPEILEVICKSIEAEFKLYKEEIIITGEGCPLNKPLP